MIEYFGRDIKPPRNRLLIAKCPQWSDTGYQICEYTGAEFYYTDQPNDNFNSTVVRWALLPED